VWTHRLLTETNEDADRVQGRLQSAMNEIKKTIASAQGNGFICTIVVLILILTILIVLVFTLK
jgi:hypothetical protein